MNRRWTRINADSRAAANASVEAASEVRPELGRNLDRWARIVDAAQQFLLKVGIVFCEDAGRGTEVDVVFEHSRDVLLNGSVALLGCSDAKLSGEPVGEVEAEAGHVGLLNYSGS